jgi:hypothetical protein
MTISLLSNSMSVTYDQNELSAEQIVELLDNMGYDAVVWETKAAEEEKPKTSAGERIVQIRFEGVHSRFVRLVYHSSDINAFDAAKIVLY